MAFSTPTDLAKGQIQQTTNDYNLPSISPTAEVGFFVCQARNVGGTPETPTNVSGVWPTWTLVASIVSADSEIKVHLYVGTGTPTSGSINVHFTGNMTHLRYQLTGHGGGDPAGAVVQSKVASTAGTDTTLAATLDNSFAAGSATVSFFTWARSNATATKDANQTLVAQNANARSAVAWLDGEDLTSSWTLDSPSELVVIAVELALAPVTITGSGSFSLPALSATASGEVAVQGVASPSLQPLSATAAGEVLVAGAATASFGALTLTATGSAGGVQGSGSPSLGALTVTGTGAVAVAGLGSPPLAAPSVAGAGSVEVRGSASAGLGPLTATAAGAALIAGTATALLPALGVVALGAVEVQGSATVTLAGLGSTATGDVLVVGAGTATLPALTLVGAGGIDRQLEGPFSLTLEDPARGLVLEDPTMTLEVRT